MDLSTTHEMHDFKFELVRDNFTIFDTSVSVEQACFANERFQPEDSAKVIANMIRYECAISLRQISCCKCVRQTTTKGISSSTKWYQMG